MMQSEEARMRWCDGDLRERWMQRRKKLAAAVADILRDGIAAGDVRKDLPADVQATFLLGLLRTRVRDLADAPEPWQKLEVAVDFFCRAAALAAPAALAALAAPTPPTTRKSVRTPASRARFA